MKRLFLMISIVLFTMGIKAQDVIFRSSTDSIDAKVLTIGTREITYQKWSNLEGPIYSIFVKDVVAIHYANGSYDFFWRKTSQACDYDTTTTNCMPLMRDGNTYLYGDLTMNKKEMKAWLQMQNCKIASSHFSTGLNLANSGWVCMGIGLSLELGATIIALTATDKSVNTLLIVMGVVSSAFEIACIPLLAVGYTKMHNAVDVYNISCSKAYATRPYCILQANSNGLGLAFKF